ncbi:MAG TPA: hypothetical protein VGX96_02255 [Candidatus Elarobacter sp.]|jgi:hypothetical protein|nr:hypothetical protein [Candidatus Elarobacter sp.]
MELQVRTPEMTIKLAAPEIDEAVGELGVRFRGADDAKRLVFERVYPETIRATANDLAATIEHIVARLAEESEIVRDYLVTIRASGVLIT